MGIKLEREKKIVKFMIVKYCNFKHRGERLCESCAELLEYAHRRLDACVYGETKSSCLRCKSHCYDKAHRQRIKEVMKYVGPRMVYLMPLEYLKHVLRK